MACRNWVQEIVELARSGAPASARLRAHLAVCPQCAVRWELEQELSTAFRQIRQACWPAAGLEAREAVMARFASERRRMLRRTRLAWALAAAAALLFAPFLARPWRGAAPFSRLARLRPAVFPQSAPWLEAPAGEAGEMDWETTESSEFVSVPYALPLASGELIRVVHTELPAIALVDMGFAVDGVDASTVTADVLVGQDAIPRAVRLAESLDAQH
jgi:hypothetical protein